MEYFTRYIDYPTSESIAEITEVMVLDLTVTSFSLITAAIALPLLVLLLMG